MTNWNNYNNNYSSYGNRYPSNTNIQYVTSLEEALSRSNTPNTENVYFHQDAQIFYRVKVDYDGRKYWQEFSYNTKQVDNRPLVRQDILELENRIRNLENMLFKSEVNNEQSNGQVSVSVANISNESGD